MLQSTPNVTALAAQHPTTAALAAQHCHPAALAAQHCHLAALVHGTATLLLPHMGFTQYPPELSSTSKLPTPPPLLLTISHP